MGVDYMGLSSLHFVDVNFWEAGLVFANLVVGYRVMYSSPRIVVGSRYRRFLSWGINAGKFLLE